MICYVNNVLDNQPKPCDERMFNSIVTRADVEQLVTAVRTGHPEKKKALPAFLLQGVLDETKRELLAQRRVAAGGRRVSSRTREFMISNGLCMIDIDRKDGFAEDLWRGYCNAMQHHDINALAVTALAHRTPSGHGLRILLPLPHGVTIEQMQNKIGELMGVDIDQTCKDVTRLSFAVPRQDFFHYDAALLFAPLPDPDDKEPTGLEPLFENENISTAPTQTKKQESAKCVANRYPDTYDGLLYTDICNALIRIAGGAPEHGARNKFIYDRARELAYICDRDSEWVAQVLPFFGEAESKARRTIQSACDNVQNRNNLPKSLTQALEEVRGAQISTGEGLPQADLMPPLPARLPALIEHLTCNVEPRYKPAVAMAVFPSLMAHLGNVRFRYIDNKLHEAVCMTICIAPQSSGKGSVCEPIRYITSDMRAEDIESQARDNAWREQCRSMGSNKQKPERPIIWTNLPSPNTTAAAMLQMAMDAQGRRMFTMMNELDMLNDLRLTPSKRDPSIPIRLAFDTDYIQANRVGANSVNGGAQFRWNFYASTTPELGVKFFLPYLFNGALSRLTLCTILTTLGDDMPVFGDYNETWVRKLQPYIDRLNYLRKQSLSNYPNDGDILQCKDAVTVAVSVEQEYKDKIVASGDPQFAELAYRAELSAYLRAMTLFCAQGEWSQEIEDFYRWSLEYDLWCKMRYFGDVLEKNCGTVKLVSGRPNSLLDQLGHTFELSDLLSLVRKRGGKTPASTLIRMWRKRNLISLTEDGNYVKMKG